MQYLSFFFPIKMSPRLIICDGVNYVLIVVVNNSGPLSNTETIQYYSYRIMETLKGGVFYVSIRLVLLLQSVQGRLLVRRFMTCSRRILTFLVVFPFLTLTVSVPLGLLHTTNLRHIKGLTLGLCLCLCEPLLIPLDLFNISNQHNR